MNHTLIKTIIKKNNDMNQRSLIFFCSELGQLCIKDYPFKKKSEVFELIWKRYDQAHYEKNIQISKKKCPSNEYSNEPDSMNQMKKCLDTIQPNFIEKIVCDHIEKMRNEPSSMAPEKKSAMIEESAKKVFSEIILNENYDKSDAAKLDQFSLKDAVGLVQTETGRFSEKSIIEMFIETHMPKQSFQSSAIPFYKKRLIINDSTSPNYSKWEWSKRIYIGGRPDSIRCSDGVPLEAKTRMKKLFQHPPNYEIYQCQGYCFIMNQKECIWVQRYKNDLDFDIIKRNDSIIEKMIQTLIRWADVLHLVLSDQSMATHYCQSLKTIDQRSNFIKDYVFSSNASNPAPKLFF